MSHLVLAVAVRWHRPGGAPRSGVGRRSAMPHLDISCRPIQAMVGGSDRSLSQRNLTGALLGQEYLGPGAAAPSTHVQIAGCRRPLGSTYVVLRFGGN